MNPSTSRRRATSTTASTKPPTGCWWWDASTPPCGRNSSASSASTTSVLTRDTTSTRREAAEFGAQLTADAEAIFRARTNAEWLALLDAAGVPAGPVRFVEELFDHPQVAANNLAIDVQHRDLGTVRMAGPPATFTDTPLQPGNLPALGEHTDAVLGRGWATRRRKSGRWRREGVL